MRITGGPNAQGWLAIVLIVSICIVKQSLLPLFIALCTLVILIPACFWLYKLDRRAGLRMLEEFPDDPYIQKKYQRYRQ